MCAGSVEQAGFIQRVDRRLHALDEVREPRRATRITAERLSQARPERKQYRIDRAGRLVRTLGMRSDGATALAPEGCRRLRH
jgi:ribosomal protein S19E (S16A)